MSVTLAQRLDEIEATLANISTIVSTTFPSYEEIESARTEIFDSLNDILHQVDAIGNMVNLLEQRINKYV